MVYPATGGNPEAALIPHERHPLPPAYSARAMRLMLDEMRQNVALIAQAVQEIRVELRLMREQYTKAKGAGEG